jgi:hypothetical protein
MALVGKTSSNDNGLQCLAFLQNDPFLPGSVSEDDDFRPLRLRNTATKKWIKLASSGHAVIFLSAFYHSAWEPP